MTIKKMIFLVMAFVLSLGLFACGETEEDPKKELLESIINGVIVDKQYKSLTGDLELPDTAGGAYLIDWTIDAKYSNNAVIGMTDEGYPVVEVTQTEEDEKFILVATISDGGITASRNWECWVRAMAVATETTCAKVKEFANDDYLQLTGKVTYVAPNRGFFLKDETGSLYIYVNGKVTVEVGDNVVVKGYKGKNYDLYELTKPTIVSSSAGQFDAASAAEKTTVVALDEMLAKFYDSTTENYVEYSASVVAKFGSFYTVEGKIVANTDSNISYKYLLKDDASGKYIVLYDSAMESAVSSQLKDLVGKTVSLTVVFWDTHSKGYGRFVPINGTITEKTA